MLQKELKVEQPKNCLLFVILSPTGPYFDSGFKPISLLADPKYVRAWHGGVGGYKLGANYGPTLAIQVRSYTSPIYNFSIARQFNYYMFH